MKKNTHGKAASAGADKGRREATGSGAAISGGRTPAPESLAESESFFRRIIDYLPLGVHLYELGADGKLVFIGANQAADRILHIDHTVFAGKTIEEAFPPLKGTEVPAKYRDVAKHGFVWQTEQIDYDDQKIRGAFQVVAFRIADNKMAALFQEITARKRAEQALQESERVLRESQLIGGLGSYELDVAAGVWRSSDIMDRVFGIDKVYKRTVDGWAALVHPDDRSMMVNYFKDEVLGKGRNFDKEYRIVRYNDKAERWVYGRGKLEFDVRGRPVKMHGTIQDITDRKLVEEALWVKDWAIESAINAIVLADLNGDLTYANPAFLRQWGYGAREEVQGRPATDFLQTGESTAQVVQKIRLRGGWIGEMPAVRKDGTVFGVEVVASVVVNTAGKPSCISASFVEIARRNRPETE